MSLREMCSIFGATYFYYQVQTNLERNSRYEACYSYTREIFRPKEIVIISLESVEQIRKNLGNKKL